MKPRTILIAVGVVLLAIVAVVLASVPKRGGPALPTSGDITGSDLRGLVGQGARLVDVRTVAEFAAGHIQGAENVPIDSVPTAAAGWDKTAPIVLYCATGARSLNASEFLKAQGFTHVYNLAKGVVVWDGDLVKGAASGAATGGPATGRPTMYDFYTDS